VKRIIVALASVITLVSFSVTLGGAAWSATNAPSTAVITFDDAAQQATLQIPSPACPASQPDCQWKFLLQIPKGDITVGIVFGTSGTLVIPYPKDFCGVIQADAYQGPPFVPKRGFQHTIPSGNCEPPTTTTTTTEPPTTTTTTTEPPTTTTSTTTPPVVPPPVSGNVQSPPPPAAPVATPVSTSTATAPLTQLPFTGKPIKPFLFAGLALVAVGLALLAPTRYWRRASRRLSGLFPRSTRWLAGTWMGRSSLNLRLRGAPSMVGCSFYGL
jgi:hypothetical protein